MATLRASAAAPQEAWIAEANQAKQEKMPTPPVAKAAKAAAAASLQRLRDNAAAYREEKKKATSSSSSRARILENPGMHWVAGKSTRWMETS